jgi:hypothetical protein
MSELEQSLFWAILADGLPEPERECRFHPVRRWRFDMAWPEYRVACEVEGGTWSTGRHVRGRGFERDCTKYNEAALAGWLVVRVTGAHIDRGRALVWIRRALEERGWRDGNN